MHKQLKTIAVMALIWFVIGISGIVSAYPEYAEDEINLNVIPSPVRGLVYGIVFCFAIFLIRLTSQKIKSIKIKTLLPVMFLIFVVAPASVSALTNVSVSPNADSFISANSPANNYGGLNQMESKLDTGVQPERLVFNFTMPSNLSGAVVQSATLNLYLESKGNAEATQTMNFYRLNAAWTELGITWNNQPAHATSYNGSVTYSATGTQYAIDVTSQVQYWSANPGNNYGLIGIADSGYNTDFVFSSKESGTVAQRPVLNITYGFPVSNWTFNQGTGNYANDSSGWNNNGTVYNTTWATNFNNGSVNSSALSFRGESNSNITIPNNESLNVTSLTISGWFKMNQTGGSYQALLSKDADAGGYDYRLLIADSRNNMRFQGNGVIDAIIPVTTYSLNTWQFVVVTYNGSTGAVYLNGILQGSAAGTGALPVNAYPVHIGKTEGTYYFINGTVDEVKLYNYALNQSEITILYQYHQPTPAYPVANINISAAYPPLTTSVNFSWHDTVYPSDRLQVAEDTAFNILIVDTYTSNDYHVASLESGKTYYWKVTQYNGTTGLSGNTSETQKFTIASAAASSDGTTGINGIVYETISGVKTPLNDVQVFIYNNSWSKTVFTGSNGYYVFSSLEANSVYYITAKKENYEDSAIQTVNTTSATWVTHDIPLIKCISVYCGYYNQQYVQFVLQSLFGTKYPNVAVSVYKGSEASTTYTGTTASDGSITFLLTKDQSYRITFINASQGVNREVTLIPVELLYVIIVPLSNSPWQEYSEQVKDAVHINVSKRTFTATDGAINITYLDDLNDTSSLIVYLNQTNTSDPYNQTVLSTWTATLPANDTLHNFSLTGYSGNQYLVHFVVTHDTYGTIDRTYAVIFDKSASVTGIPNRAWSYLAILIMIFTAGVFTYSTAEKGLMVICGEGWIFMFLGWFNAFDTVKIGVALTLVSALSVMAYISRSQKMEGYA